MKDSLTISLFVSVIYLIVKFINMNFVEKDTRSVKVIMKDVLFVFISVNLGLFLMTQVLPQSGGDVVEQVGKSVQAFTGDPEF
tara:strand:+ start:149 stop:397 length:249 start_codon:yes stop_codon:yes gene_type:complete